MTSKDYLTSLLVPPAATCRCGSYCTAPITVFWIFGVVSVVYGFLGGPAGEAGISWYTVGLGVLMWGIAAVWTVLTMKGVEADCNNHDHSPRAHKVAVSEGEADPLDEVKKAR